MGVTASNLQGSQDPNAAAAKKQFIQCFTLLFVFEILLAIMMITVSGIAVSKYNSYTLGGPGPYLIGGFLLFAVLILGAVISGCLAYKGGSAESGQLTQMAPVLQCGLSVFIFTFMGCLISFSMLGILGFSYCERYWCDEVRPLLTTLVIGTVLTVIMAIVGLYAVCRYGKYFGVNITHRGYGVHPFMTRSALTNHTLQMVTQLQRQNELLQQQLFSQQQLQQQQQQLDWNFPQQQPQINGYRNTGNLS